MIVNSAGQPDRRDLEDIPDSAWYDAWELNVMAPMRLMRAAVPAMAERGWGRVVNIASSAGKRPSAMMGEYSVAKAAELSLSRLYADRYAGSGVLVNAVCPGPVKSEMWMEPGGLLDQSVDAGGTRRRDAALEAAGSKRPIGRLAEVDEIAVGDHLPVLGAGLLRARGGLGRRRRHRPGDHLSGGPGSDLAGTFLDPVEAEGLKAHGSETRRCCAAVRVARSPGLILTERRRDLRRHGGEISFPGGRAEPGETLVECALREAQEEIGLDPEAVEVSERCRRLRRSSPRSRSFPWSASSPHGSSTGSAPTRSSASSRSTSTSSARPSACAG